MRPEIITSKTYSLCAVCILLLSYGVALYLLFSRTEPVNAAPQATFVVNSLADTNDVVGNGICADSLGNCTLRAAIREANHNGNTPDTITFAVSGTIYLDSALPDLTADNTTIDGFGQNITITKAANAGHFNALTITSWDNVIQNLTITGMTAAHPNDLSSPDSGNGIRFRSAPRDNWLDYLTISNNARDGIAMEGTNFRENIIVRSTIRDNGRNGITVRANGQAFGKLNSIVAVTTIVNNGDTGISVTGAGLWVTGNTLDNNPTALDQANDSDFFIVYANNIVNYDTATLTYAGSGKRLIGHNWWDSHNTMPAGLTTTEWSHRLGAPIVAWVDAFGTAYLLDGHGLGPGYENPPLSDAVLGSSTSTDIAVIISHGRDPNNIPFGNTISGIDNLCSDYYDFFVIDSNASSSWTLSLPIDNNNECNEQTRNPKILFTITDVDECAEPPALNCWSQVPTAAVTISGQQLIISNLTTAALGGTPFVAGPTLDSSSITLTATSARMIQAYPIEVVIILLLLGLVSATMMARRSSLNRP